jgi:hypothetical protein
LALQNDLLNDSSDISNDSFSNSRRSSNRLSGIKSNNTSIQFLRKSMSASKSPRQSLSSLEAIAAAEMNDSCFADADNKDRRNTINVNDLQWLNEEIGKENVSQSLDESNTMTASPSKTNSISSLDLSLSKPCSTLNSKMTNRDSFGLDQDSNALPAQFEEKESQGTIDARDLDLNLSNASCSKMASQEASTSSLSVDDNWLEAALNTCSAATEASAEKITSGKKRRSSVMRSEKKIRSSSKNNQLDTRRETIDNVAWLNAALETSTAGADENLDKSRRETLDAGWLDAALETSSVSAGNLNKSKRDTLDAALLDAELESSKASDASNLLASRVEDTIMDRNDRRETIDSFDRDWLLNEVGSCNESSMSSNSARNKSRVSSKHNRSRLSISSRNISKTSPSSARASMLSLSSPAEADDDIDNVSVLTMNTMDVAHQVHDLLEDEDMAVRHPKNHLDNDALNVSEMSFATVNTMDLMGAVQQAIEEEEQNRSMDADDMSSVVPLQELLRRPSLTPASNDSKRRNKRRTRSPAVNSTRSSPALQKVRVHSPASAVVASGKGVPRPNENSTVDEINDSLFQSPPSSTLTSAISTPVSMKDISSVIHSALTLGEPVVLRSCLSARKVRKNGPFSANKSVAFGSPNVAEFRKHSPTTSFTPLDRQQAKQLFSMQEHVEMDASAQDEVTIDNERILEEWDRLTNASEGNSSDEDVNDDIVLASSVPVADKENIQKHDTSLNMSRHRNRRRLSKLQPLLELEAEDQPSTTDSSAMQQSSACDVSCTVQLPATMSDLIAQNDVSVEPSSVFHATNMSAFSQEASRTVDIEQDLHELMQNIDAVKSTAPENRKNQSMEVSQEPSRTMDIEDDLQHLMSNINQDQLSQNSGDIFSEEFHPLRSAYGFRHSIEVESNDQEQETDYGRMPLRTSSILPATFRLSVGSVAASVASRESDLSEGVLQSIFGRRINSESVRVDSSSAMEEDESRYEDLGNSSKISDVSVSALQNSIPSKMSKKYGVSASSVSKSEFREDLERLVASQDVSVASSPAASHVSMILTTNDSNVSSNASTVQDNEENGMTGNINHNISFIDAKKRIIFGSAFKNPATVDISSISTQNNQLQSNTSFGSNVVVNQSNNALLQRLHALKEGARRNTLSQCMTPGVRNKQQSREFQRLSLQHQQLQLVQQSISMANSSSQKRRVSVMPSPIVPGAMDKSTVLLMDSSTADNMDVDEDEQMISEPSNLDLSCAAVQFDASMSLLKSSAANISRLSLLNASGSGHVPADTSISVYRVNEEIKANALLLFQVAQNLNQFLSTVDDSLQMVILQAAQETFAMAIKGLVLGFEHLDADLVFSAFQSQENERSAEEYVAMICDAVRDHPAPFNEERAAMALLGCSDWEKIWTNLLATAVFELSEALKQVQLQQSNKNDHNDVFSMDRNRTLDKMLDKRIGRRQSGSILELSASVAQAHSGTFSRFYSIEEYMQNINSPSNEGKDRIVESYVADSNAQQKQQQELGFRLDMWNKILNRMTFLQVREVFEDRLSVAAHLTDTVQLTLTFQLESDPATDLLLVKEVDSQLIVNGTTRSSSFSPNSLDLSQMNISGALVGVDESSDTRVCTAQENAIALAYFGEFLVPDLKQRQEQLQCVSDVPAFLSVVAAHVPVLRKMLCFVRVLHMVGGLVMVCKQSVDNSVFQLNMDHIDLREPISVDLRVLVATLQMPSVFKLLSEDSGQHGVVEVMKTLEIAQQYSQ